MYLRWIDYKCPGCGMGFASRMTNHARVGPETNECWKCKRVNQTPDKEWKNMSLGMRVEYFATVWTIAFFLFFVAAGAAAGWQGIIAALSIWLVFYLPVLLTKLYKSKQSLKRSPPNHC
jgi:hypothetical protein